MLRTRARRATINMSDAYLRQLDPDLPKYLPPRGPAARIIAALRRRKRLANR